MVWIRYRMQDGRPTHALAPVVYASSGTITKDGVMFCRPNGELVEFVPLASVAEFVDDTAKYTLTVEQERYKDSKGIEHAYSVNRWTISIPVRDSVGRIIG